MTRPADDDLDRLLRLAGPRPGAPADAAARVHDLVRERWRGALARRRRRWGAALGAGALVALAVWALAPRSSRAPAPAPAAAARIERVTGQGLRSGSAAASAGAAVAAGTWLETPAEARAAVRMASGASVRLDGATRLQVVSTTVLRLERGAVYVDSDGAKSAVRVHTAGGEVREVGTQFQVRYAAPATQVLVRTGEVVLRLGAATHAAAAGVALDVADGRVRRSAVAPYGPSWDWVATAAPEFALEGRTLADFLGWAARETGLALRYDEAGLQRAAEQVRLHGSTRGLTPSEALEAVLPASDFRAVREAGTLRVARPRR